MQLFARTRALLPVLALLPGLAAHGQEDIDAVEISMGSREPIRLTRYDDEAAAIQLDGRLDEAAWQDTRPYTNLRVIEPDTLAEPAYRTEIRFFYTERGLYVSYDMEQPKETLLRRFSPRDDFDTKRDKVSFTLDTSGGGRYGYWMSVALGDNQADGTILPERQYSREWDGAWYGSTAETDKGWAAEYFIPWSQMAMPKEDRVRRIGFYGSREVGHLDQRWGWPALPNSLPRFMSLLQPLEIEGIDPRQQWSLFPYASSTVDWYDDETRYKVGADVFWRPASNFQLTATLNPDFGSVESDDVVVNLTANENFFPEKRLFFQEGSEIFDATPRAGGRRGGGGGDRNRFTVINTRRIGGRPREIELADGVDFVGREDLQVADLFGAAKATGQIGGFRYGVLAASEDETDFLASDGEVYAQEGRDFGAVRVIYEDSEGAAYRGFGLVSTIVAHPESDAMVHAMDFHYLTTNGYWNLDGQVLYSDVDDTGQGKGAYADLTYTPRRGFRNEFRFTYFDDELEVNDFGFNQRANLRDFQYRGEWVRSGLKRVRNTKFSPFYRYGENTQGQQVLGGMGGGFEITFNNLHFLDISAAYLPERYEDRNSFGNGTYHINDRSRFGLRYRTNEASALSAGADVQYEAEEIEGRQLTYTGSLTWRPASNLSLQLEAQYTDRDGWLLHQEDRNFTSFVAEQWQPKLNFDYFINADHQLRLGLQWVGVRAVEDRFYELIEDGGDLVEGPKPPGETDDFSISQLNLQFRYRWQIAPLSDLFVVYTRADTGKRGLASFGDLFQDSWNNPLGDQLVIKLRYRLGS
ncbi:MAG: DUF5916 domain-containing protein [Gammaproteobacteria bacterium]|nr:DUF5916 domain-containing protein [Gammaproteobacteria bacterium]